MVSSFEIILCVTLRVPQLFKMRPTFRIFTGKSEVMFNFPFSDWLDIGNNKKALQECDKVLKKTPNLQCAKALKALTLHRMGKESEAANILDALTAERPTDDATLQAMTLCYRELQQRVYLPILQHASVRVKHNPTFLL